MKINANLSDDVLLKLLGERLATLRLGKNMTQQQLALEAGLGLRTVQRLELGLAATQLSGFIRICRVLGLVEGFEVLVPESFPSPLAQLKLRGKERKRASSAKPKAVEPAGPWQWGKGSNA